MLVVESGPLLLAWRGLTNFASWVNLGNRSSAAPFSISDSAVVRLLIRLILPKVSDDIRRVF
jgi:hypothetical protein